VAPPPRLLTGPRTLRPKCRLHADQIIRSRRRRHHAGVERIRLFAMKSGFSYVPI